MLPSWCSALVIMDTPVHLAIHPASHPRVDVHRAGFPLEHPYVEQCWTPVLGPSSVLLLRRVSWWWRDSTPALLTTSDLGAQLGLGRGTGKHSPANRTADRIVRFGFGQWSGPSSLDVYTEVPPVPAKQLARLPQWCAERHELLSAHLAELSSPSSEPSPASPLLSASNAGRMITRLDHLADAPATAAGLRR